MYLGSITTIVPHVQELMEKMVLCPDQLVPVTLFENFASDIFVGNWNIVQKLDQISMTTKLSLISSNEGELNCKRGALFGVAINDTCSSQLDTGLGEVRNPAGCPNLSLTASTTINTSTTVNITPAAITSAIATFKARPTASSDGRS